LSRNAAASMSARHRTPEDFPGSSLTTPHPDTPPHPRNRTPLPAPHPPRRKRALVAPPPAV
jgi:hypothetical protein